VAEYTPPPPAEVNFTFRGTPYVPPVATEVNFTFGAEEGDGPQTGLLKANYTILLTI